MLLGMAASSNVDGFDLDYRFVPFLIGSLYGGVPVMVMLAFFYMLSRLMTMDDWWEWIELGGTMLIVVPLLFLTIRTFEQSHRKRRQGITLTITAAMLAVLGSSFAGFCFTHKHPLSMDDWLYMAAHGLFYILTIAAAVHLAEDYIERQTMAHELQRLSNNYRIEVQKLQQFIEETPLGVIFVDRKGVVTHINEMAVLFLQHKVADKSRRDMIGTRYTELYDNVQNDALGKLLQLALAGHETSSELVQEQGKIFLNTGICVRDMQNNDIIGAAIIAHDITELNRLRDELGKMERLSLVGQMAASITHEIRNPMAVIRGFVQLMRERSPDHQQEYFRIVMDELDRANSIINDFLSLAQNRIIEKESCSLHDLINEMLPLLWADANMRGQSIELELSDRMPALMLNEKEMKQLILNLARNGMEAMDQKGVLSLRTKVRGKSVELWVVDTGCGIPQEKLERLFEPFYTTKTRGTGLGLPLCLSIVERHGGQIDVESVEGQGTSFIVRFAAEHEWEEVAAASE